MNTRYDLARELIGGLLVPGPPGSFLEHNQFCDFCRIAEAIERGDSREDILHMAETNRWQDTFVWLKENI